MHGETKLSRTSVADWSRDKIDRRKVPSPPEFFTFLCTRQLDGSQDWQTLQPIALQTARYAICAIQTPHSARIARTRFLWSFFFLSRLLRCTDSLLFLSRVDFLPFTCRGCNKVFCAEHRKPSDHGCTVSFDVRKTPSFSLSSPFHELFPSSAYSIDPIKFVANS